MNVLHPSEVRQLLAAVDVRDAFGLRDRALIELCLHTGLRVGELVALDVATACAADGTPRQALYLTHTKGDRKRVVPMNDHARRAVATILAFNAKRGFSTTPERPLFVTKKHGRMTVRAVQRLIEGLRKKAQLDVPASPHSLRHVFASNVLSCTGNVRVVQCLIGHKNLSSTMIYTHPTRQELAAAVDRLAEGGASPCVS